MTIEHDHSTLRIRRTPSPDAHASESDEAQLIVLVGHSSGRRFQLGDRLELGRGPQSPIEILDDGVSRRHAVVYREEDGEYRIKDLCSRNGTFVNGIRIEDEPLSYGDKIAVGSRTVVMFAHRDRFEDQRLQAQKLQALGQLAGGIAHDFNNLLGVVLANITHVQSNLDANPAELQQTLAEVETAARRAVDLTNQLLTFARSGQRRNVPTPIAPLIDDAQRLIGRTLPRTITVSCSNDDVLAFVGDASQVLQVLMNLCINAGDAMPNGGSLALHARARMVTEAEFDDNDALPPGEYVSITVRDTGVGMRPDVAARVFEPFFTTKPRGKGTGLGLATAFAIVRDHGGHISLDSMPGEGTTFEVLLPLANVVPEEDAAHQEMAVGPGRGVVLLADDEGLIRLASRRVLSHSGIEVIMAEDGHEAVTIFAANADRVDVVILDLDMPQLSGAEAFEQIHAIKPDVPVLISSGYIDHDQEEALVAAGVQGVLHKPYDSRALLQAVLRTLPSHAEDTP